MANFVKNDHIQVQALLDPTHPASIFTNNFPQWKVTFLKTATLFSVTKNSAGKPVCTLSDPGINGVYQPDSVVVITIDGKVLSYEVCEIGLQINGTKYYEHFASDAPPGNIQPGCVGWVECVTQ